jgi:predicted ATPase
MRRASLRTGGTPFLRTMRVADGAPKSAYPFDIPAVRELGTLAFGKVTVFVGDNGSGKSTLVEALAVAAGFNAEGGSKNLRFETMATESDLSAHLRLAWEKRPGWGWFLRAETFYGMATHLARDIDPGFGHRLHARSHGQSFLELMRRKFTSPGLYIMDEPESALSFDGQLQLLSMMRDGVRAGSQFVVATHSPLLMAAAGATIYELDDRGITRTTYDDVRAVGLWRRFLANPGTALDADLSGEG